MSIAPLIIAFLFAAIALFALTRWGRFGRYDLAALAVLTSVALYLSRFDRMLRFSIGDRPYPGFYTFLVLLASGLLLARLALRGKSKLGLQRVFLLIGLFVYLGLLSGLLNKGSEGFYAALQVMVIAVAPMMVAWQLMELVPANRLSSERLRFSLILLAGVLTPMFLLLTSVAADLFGALLGWGQVAASRSAGFVRGWSPLGGPIATGTVMVLGYGLAMHEVVGRNRKPFLLVLILVATAMLFTLSRSALLMLLVFHAVYFWDAIRKHPVRVGLVAALGSLALIVAVVQVGERYNFERFLLMGDSSTAVRASSAQAALSLSWEAPFLGNGPGLVYETIRTEWLERSENTSATRRNLERNILVGNQVSALEPHNLYVFLGVEHGWIAALAFCGIFFLLFRRTFLPKRIDDPEAHSLGLTLRALWIAWLAMFMTSSGPLVNPQVSVFLWTFGFYSAYFSRVHGVERHQIRGRSAEPRGVSVAPWARR